MTRSRARLAALVVAVVTVLVGAPAGATDGADASVSREAEAAAVTGRTPKKGVATWEMPGVTRALEDVGARWYYNWSPTRNGTASPAGTQFVPMIWGADSVTAANPAAARRHAVILGFNEPDLAEQANVTVARALELWPRLQATGRVLGSPAVAWGGDRAGGWLDRFMAGARQRDLRLDFIALHRYGSDFSSAGRSYESCRGRPCSRL